MDVQISTMRASLLKKCRYKLTAVDEVALIVMTMTVKKKKNTKKWLA